MAPLRTLSTRIAVPAGFFALVSIAVLSWLLIRGQRENAVAEAVHGSESLSEAVLLSIEHEMRVNERDAIREIVEAVGHQEGVRFVRLLNKDGRISFSSMPDEVGGRIDMRAEACVLCHPDGSTAVAVTDGELLYDRSRLFESETGERLLGTMRVVPNGEGCQGSQCHADIASQPVLGVLDVTSSMEPAETRLATAARQAFLYSLLAASLITATLFLMIWQSVRRPINTIVEATRRVAGAHGGADVALPRGSAPELDILAESFNEMVEGLNSSRAELEGWAATLEDTVADKARELRDAQFQVVQAEKLSSVGLVAAGIAHELNSPLMAIVTFTHLVRNTLPDDSQAQEDLRMIEREANRCAAIIRQLLDFARKQSQDPETEPCSIATAVSDALDLIKVEVQNVGIRVHTVVSDTLPLVEANPVQLMQVLVNLLLNAVHAMPDGGTLTITADVQPRAGYRFADLPPHGGTKLARIMVRDTGVGIPPKDLPRVFDPFFTTKPVGKGSGLGLSVSLGLVRGYRGTILVDSDGVTGTLFTVLLPVPDQLSSG